MELLLLLADGRFPAGGSAHSGGLETAVADGAVHDLATLERFVTGRVSSTGSVDAWVAAAAARIVARVGPASAELWWLQGEAEARMAVPALRAAGRSIGRGLRRSARSTWPEAASIEVEQHAVVLGAVAALAGLTPLDAARWSLHSLVLGVVGAAPKLLPLDAADAMAVAVHLAPLVDAAAEEAATTPVGPAWSAPLVDEAAHRHATWEVRLFAT